MANLLSIGLSGLSASKVALNVTGNNITNADTDGYTRQTTVQTAAVSQKSGNAYIGTGTTLNDVRRIYSSFLGTQLRTTTALNSDAQSYYANIQQVNSLLADSTTGVSTVLQNFFSSLQTAAASPTDNASRQLLLTQAGSLSDRFNSIYAQLADQNGYINEQLSSMTSQANKLAASVGQYNLAITQASASGATPNDLLDARDEAVKQLSEMVGVTVVNQDGNYNLYIGSGQPLVVGNAVSKLGAVPSTDDPTRYAITLSQGNSTQDVTAAVTGGEIGGLLRYRTEVLDSTTNDLGRMALVIADTVNSQLAQGLDLNGEFGAALFGDINSSTLVSQRSVAQVGNSSKTANFEVTIENSSALSTSDYEVKFTSDTEYTVTRLADGTVFPSDGAFKTTDTQQPVIDGFALSLQGGNAAAGDKFTIMPTRYGAGTISVSMTDAQQLAFAAPLVATATTGNYGTGSVTQPDLLFTATSAGLPGIGDPDGDGIPTLTAAASIRINDVPINLAAGSALSDVVSTINASNTGVTASEADGQLVLTSAENFSIRDGDANGGSAALGLTVSNEQAVPSLQAGLPVKMVFGSVADGSQSYTLFDSSGVELGNGEIIPGNSNALTVKVGTAPAFTFQTTIGGSPAEGDSFTFAFNADGTSDNRNAQSLLDLQTKATVGSAKGSGMSFVTAYSSLVEQVGAETSEAELDATATSSVLAQAQSNWESKSGVNLDEEAANLIKFEQYYSAASQIIQIARSTFDTLINSF